MHIRRILTYTGIAFVSAVALTTIIGGVAVQTSAFALTVEEGVMAARGDGVPTNLFGADGVLTTLTNVLLFIVGALSVIMLIFGGLRYTISGGNATAITAAKNTVLYAIVGLLIAFFAYAAINFVLGAVSGGGGAGGSDWTNV